MSLLSCALSKSSGIDIDSLTNATSNISIHVNNCNDDESDDNVFGDELIEYESDTDEIEDDDEVEDDDDDTNDDGEQGTHSKDGMNEHEEGEEEDEDGENERMKTKHRPTTIRLKW